VGLQLFIAFYEVLRMVWGLYGG